MVGLREGDSGERVKYLQELLVKGGHSVGGSGIDGDYGPNASKAVLAARKAEAASRTSATGSPAPPPSRSCPSSSRRTSEGPRVDPERP
ncbi:peptidoglycan-binding protein [Nocardiopsis mangrovi]|uniref:Peptidoglycan-binding protein n=1 Tax=Nocardiopsis mangrovi TaxID=1179818 RepID=A0ABV9DZB4_9ACTN